MDDPSRESAHYVWEGGPWPTPVHAASSSNRPSTQLDGVIGIPWGQTWYRDDTFHGYPSGDWDASAEHAPTESDVRGYAQDLVRRAYARGLGGSGQTVPAAQRRRHAEEVIRGALRTYVRRRYGTSARQRLSRRRAPARRRRRR